MYKPLKARLQLKDLGYQIGKKIQEKQLNIDHLAKRASVNAATILKIIGGGNSTLITLLKLADAIPLDLGELFDEMGVYDESVFE